MTSGAVVLYQDDGPNGPCGQSCHITKPWCDVHIFNDRNAFENWKEGFDKVKNSRRNPRLTWIDTVFVHENGGFRTFQGDDRLTVYKLRS